MTGSGPLFRWRPQCRLEWVPFGRDRLVARLCITMLTGGGKKAIGGCIASRARAFKGADRCPAGVTVEISPALAALKGSKMARQIVFSPKAARPPPTYSQAVRAAGLVFVSGTAPTDPITGAFKGTTVQEQTAQCLTNIQAILEEAGSSLDKIVSVTIVLADEEDFAGMNEEWLKWFPANPPARQGAKLPARIPGLKISIAAIAEA
jgi:2-iminobutanoate/2-iminopropanoate deaminase